MMMSPAGCLNNKWRIVSVKGIERDSVKIYYEGKLNLFPSFPITADNLICILY